MDRNAERGEIILIYTDDTNAMQCGADTNGQRPIHQAVHLFFMISWAYVIFDHYED